MLPSDLIHIKVFKHLFNLQTKYRTKCISINHSHQQIVKKKNLRSMLTVLNSLKLDVTEKFP